MDTPLTDPRCPKCGAVLPEGAPLGVCPACLLAVAAEPASQLTDAATGDLTTAVSSGAYSSEPARFAPGDTCGSYRIVGLLGRGGMGEVYEAVGADGRRVALKLLRQRLASQTDRDRFLREGVLAASVTHANCVYVYGSEEIDGLPVIAMELAPQGTLKQAVEQFGPRTPSQAVREILQLVAGLEAAAAAGILHRDVKPSNCFIDADGGIKVGDFGLSMSLNASEGDIAWKPTFQGTPEYAAPEQLRGEPLDLRADIYSAGATLFFLLTGYSPFGERNIQKLIELKTTRPLPGTSEHIPDIPKGLSALVGRCMSPDPNRRPQTYKDLREQLLPFVAAGPSPATVRRRAAALFLDSFSWQLVLPIVMALQSITSWNVDRSAAAVLSFVIYTVCEHWFGGTPGKLILGIRVIDVSGGRPSFGQAAARWAIALGPQMTVPSLMDAGVLNSESANFWMVLVFPVFSVCNAIYAALRKDIAMLHDLWTDTRVVIWEPKRVETFEKSSDVAVVHSVETTPADVARVGPFDVAGRIGETSQGDLLLARDARLRRFVWIHRRPNSPGALPAARRQLSQPTRLRWLAGDETWDAFEAPDGRAFHSAAAGQFDWRNVSPWLVDLSRDLEAAEAAGVVPELSLERLWVLNSGKTLLLDFHAPGAPSEPEPPMHSVPSFLALLAEEAQRVRKAPHSVTLVTASLYESWMTTRVAAALLQKLVHEPVKVSRWQRAIPTVICAMCAVLAAAGTWLDEVTAMARYDRPNAELRLLLDQMSPSDELKGSPEARTQLRAFVAESFRADLSANPGFWSSTRGRQFREYRAAIEHAVKWNRPLSAKDAEAAKAAVESWFRAERAREVRNWEIWSRWQGLSMRLSMKAIMVLVPIALASLLISFVSSPFLFRASRQSLFDEDGIEAGIVRRVGRAAVTWCPLLLIPLSNWAAIAVLAAGAVYAIASPERSIQDRIAGTFVAPR